MCQCPYHEGMMTDFHYKGEYIHQRVINTKDDSETKDFVITLESGRVFTTPSPYSAARYTGEWKEKKGKQDKQRPKRR